MSLTVDGVWKVGVWATTVWADGVWREGAPTAVVVTAGGIGKGGKSRRVYIERDGKLLLFQSAANASAFVEAEKAIEKAREPDSPVLKPSKPRAIPKPQEIDVKALKAFYDDLEARKQQSISELIRLEDFDRLLTLQKAYIDFINDEEESTLFLLMG